MPRFSYAFVAVLFLHLARVAASDREDPVTSQSPETADHHAESSDELGQGVCKPALPIFHMVMKQTSILHFIHDGAPRPTKVPLQDVTTLRSCQRWEKGSCCTDRFFEQLAKIEDGEAKRFQMIRDYYQFIVNDVVQPAILALERSSESERAAKAHEVKELLEKSALSRAVVEHVDQCEDKIRLFFGATVCELCDPHLSSKITEERILRLNNGACSAMHDSCKDMPQRLKDAATLFVEASEKMSEAARGLPVNTHSAREVVRDVVHAALSLKKASIAIDAAASRVEFYKERAQMCDKLSSEGFVYRPGAWADLDKLHPGSFSLNEPKPHDEDAEETKEVSERASEQSEVISALQNRLESIQETEQSLGDSAAPSQPTRFGVKAPTSCERGKLVKTATGYECQCLPCWTGNKCEVPLGCTATRRQRFKPLSSEPQAQPQSLTVLGCNMFDAEKPLQSMMSHIKVVQSGPITDAEKTHLNSFGITSHDVCLVRPSAEGFDSLLSQVPVTTFEEHLEWLVHVPEITGASRRYTVCFCHGPECLMELADTSASDAIGKFKEKDALSWYSAGHVHVEHVEPKIKIDKIAGDTSKNWYDHHAPLPQKTCGDQWAYGDLSNNGVTSLKVQGDMVTFSCAKNFVDLIGTRWLRCIDGTWFEEPEREEKEKTDTLKAWDQHLPYCRWKYTQCKLPKTEMSGGNVTIQGGTTRYSCRNDHRLVIDKKVVPAASFVRWCTESGEWEPSPVPTCEPWFGKVDRLPGTRENITDKVPGSEHSSPQQTKTPPSLIQLESSESHITSEEQDAHRSKHHPQALAQATSFVELGSRAQQMHRSFSARDGVETSTRAKSRVSIASASRSYSTARAAKPGILRLHPWKLQFTTDSTHLFKLDKCWISWDCASGQVPDDAAASPFYGYVPPIHEVQVPWSAIIAAAATLVASMAVAAVLQQRKKKADSA